MPNPPNPAFGPMDEARRRLLRGTNKLEIEIQKHIKAGLSPDKAINKAFQTLGIEQALIDDTFRAITVAMETGAAVGLAKISTFRTVYLNEFFSGENLTLSDRIHDLTKNNKAIIAAEIKSNLKAGSAWTKLARAVDAKDLTRGDIAGHIQNLVNTGRRAGLSGEDMISYKRALRKSKAQVARLAQAGAPTTRLKKAYEAVIRATESGKGNALENAITRAVKAKSRYNTERVSRTEIARAYGEGFNHRLHTDPDAVAWKWFLSSRHPQFDICDLHSTANLHGIGPGVYPKDRGPRYPAHPHCMCHKQPIFKGQAKKKINDDKAISYINSLNQKEKNLLMGVQGAKRFKGSPKAWKKVVRMYGDEVSTKPKLSKKLFKKKVK